MSDLQSSSASGPSPSPFAADSREVIENPYPFYEFLREQSPVHFDERSRSWCLSRFADLEEATRRWDVLSSQVFEDHHDHLASMDPPRHDVHRAAAGRLFTPRRVAELEPMVRERCRRLLERLDGRGSFDLTADLAALLPSEVITSFLGMPDELRDDFRERALAVAKATLGGDLQGAQRSLQELTWKVVTGEHPPKPGRLLDALIAGLDPDDPEVLSETEVVGLCTNLVLAGTDTATNLIGSAVVELDKRPELLREVSQSTELLALFIEEVLRYESPVQWLGRRALVPYELHGVTIPAGGYVRLYWGAGNRDPRQFDSPELFDPRRPAARHLAFGYGLHFCLGTHLARLEATVALQELFRFGFPEVDHGGLVRLPASIFRGFEHVPVSRRS